MLLFQYPKEKHYCSDLDLLEHLGSNLWNVMGHGSTSDDLFPKRLHQKFHLQFQSFKIHYIKKSALQPQNEKANKVPKRSIDPICVFNGSKRYASLDGENWVFAPLAIHVLPIELAESGGGVADKCSEGYISLHICSFVSSVSINL